MMKFALAVALMALPAPGSMPSSDPLPEWLAGEWILRDGARWRDERWSVPGVRMLGMTREGDWGGVESSEILVIEPVGHDELVLIAHPRGVRPVVFPMVRRGASSIEFANPANSYPQQIRYWRAGTALTAEISLLDGTRTNSWTYEPRGPFGH